MLEQLKREVYEANMALPRTGFIRKSAAAPPNLIKDFRGLERLWKMRTRFLMRTL